jgi:hypothetical protein
VIAMKNRLRLIAVVALVLGAAYLVCRVAVRWLRQTCDKLERSHMTWNEGSIL